VAGVVAFSGRLLVARAAEADATLSRPPVLLIHGDQDDVVPPQSLPEAAEALQTAGWKDVYAHVMKGTAHGIAPDGLVSGAGLHARQAEPLAPRRPLTPRPLGFPHAAHCLDRRF
jgi:predicted esterase